jgi:3-phenylpropionate/trans-cinnamate dioxygenase ferredoxin reductase subunit
MSDAPDPAGRIVIAGGGHAGGAACAALRQFGWKGPITLVGTEPLPPYQRPPLSKDWLKGLATAESLALRPPRFYADREIELRLDTTVLSIDRAARSVATSDGAVLPYDHLILALGARARRIALPGLELAGVLELRTAADADELKLALEPGRVLAVIGGGYVGLEAAASARSLGAEAVIIEREARVLARVACPELSAFFQATHEAHGVRILCNASVVGLEGEGGVVRGVRLADGRVIACDAALIGVGAVPNTELASEAGLECEGGIVVDLRARTSDPAISAIGDCTWRPLPLYGRSFRLESVPNALEQARQAATALCGRAAPIPEVPWFWSDQYDVKLQIAGLAFDAPISVMRGDPAGGSFAMFHLTMDHRLQAVEAVNMAPAFMAGRQMIAKRKPIAPDDLRDLSLDLKDLAA